MGNKYLECKNCTFYHYISDEVPCSACAYNKDLGPMNFSDQVFCHDGCKISYADREYITGAKRDSNEGKGRMDLLPWTAIMEVSKLCQKGAEHYGEHNVDKGIPLSSLCDSGARHLAKFIDGWDDEDHLVAAAWNILWALQMREKNPEMCDIPWKGDK